MGNIMTSIYTGVSGIQNNQTGMNVTSHNLANINTKGYVRQQMIGSDSNYVKIGTNAVSSLLVGNGSAIEAVRQVRETFIDKSYRLESGRYGFYNVQAEAINEVETIMGELEGEAFHVEITDFWSSLQELIKEPNSISKRSALVSSATSLIERADAVQDALGKYQENLNSEIQSKTDRVNEIGKEIFELNKKIIRYEVGGQNANDYRDRRNSLLDELGELVKYSYAEDSVGNITINVEGRQFVTEDSCFQIKTKELDNQSGLLTVVWDNGMDTPLYDLSEECTSENNTNVGSLKGLLLVRGDYKANYTSLPVRERFDSEADYQAAMRKYDSEVSHSSIMKTQAQFDQLIHGIVTEINDILCPNVSIEGYLQNTGVDTTKVENPTITINGKTTEVDFSTSKIKIWDKMNAPVGADENSTPREALFDRKNIERYTEATMTYTTQDEKGDPVEKTVTVYVYNEEDPEEPYSLFTLGEIKINENIKKDVSILPLNGTSEQGLECAYNMKIGEKLSEIFNKKFAPLNPGELISYSFSDYYTALVGRIGTEGQTMETMSSKQDSMRESLDNQRTQVMGVSSEEELTNLIKYQHGYNASSKYIAVINEMLDTIINGMG